MPQNFAKVNYGPKFQERFWRKVFVRDLDECWPWLRCTREKYGRIYPVSQFVTGYKDDDTPKYSTITARRLAGILTGILDPDEKTYIKPCPDPLCCNPLHIAEALHRVGTRTNEGCYTIDDAEPGGYSQAHPVSINRTGNDEVKDEFFQALKPLTSGKTVFLKMTVPGFRTTKTIGDPAPRTVALVPGESMGLDPGYVMVAVFGRGSTIIDLVGKPKIANVVLAGMPEKLAKALVDKLHDVYQES